MDWYDCKQSAGSVKSVYRLLFKAAWLFFVENLVLVEDFAFEDLRLLAGTSLIGLILPPSLLSLAVDGRWDICYDWKLWCADDILYETY